MPSQMMDQELFYVRDMNETSKSVCSSNFKSLHGDVNRFQFLYARKWRVLKLSNGGDYKNKSRSLADFE